MELSILVENAALLARGVWTTIWLSAVIVAASLLLGNVVAAMRISGIPPVAWLAQGYTDLLRATPLLMVLFWFYFALPLMTGQSVSPLVAVLTAMVAFRTAIMAEIVRGGIRAVSPGQSEAALASGMSRPQAMLYVVLPQAFTNMLPAIVSQSVATVKSTSLAYVLGVIELTRVGQIVISREYRSSEILLATALIYFLVCYTISSVGQRLWQRQRARSGTSNA